MPFYELRQYRVRPGKMAEWIALMEEEIIPLQVAKGMVISGSFRGETDEFGVRLAAPVRKRGGAREAVCRGLRGRSLEDLDLTADRRIDRPGGHSRSADRSNQPLGLAISRSQP